MEISPPIQTQEPPFRFGQRPLKVSSALLCVWQALEVGVDGADSVVAVFRGVELAPSLLALEDAAVGEVVIAADDVRDPLVGQDAPEALGLDLVVEDEGFRERVHCLD